jgi:hypothetical protein
MRRWGIVIERWGLLAAATAVLVLSWGSPAGARTLIAEPDGIEAGPTLAGAGVAWAEGRFGGASKIQRGSGGSRPITVARFPDPAPEDEFQFVGSLAGSETNLAFVRGTYRSVMNGDHGTVYDLGAELFAGPLGSPAAIQGSSAIREDENCSQEIVAPEFADLDGRTVALVEEVYPCVAGSFAEPSERLLTIDLGTGERAVLDEQPVISGFGNSQVRIEGAYVAWRYHVGPRYEDRISVYDLTDRSDAYSVVVATGASAIDVQADGKLAAMRGLMRKDGLGSARAVPVWFSKQEPFEHPLPFRASDIAPMEISDDQIVFQRGLEPATGELVVSRLDGTSARITRFSRARRLAAGGRIDLDGSNLTYAERRRTPDGKAVRIYLQVVPPQG